MQFFISATLVVVTSPVEVGCGRGGGFGGGGGGVSVQEPTGRHDIVVARGALDGGEDAR